MFCSNQLPEMAHRVWPPGHPAKNHAIPAPRAANMFPVMTCKSGKPVFHKRGQDPESAWCTSLPARNHYRLDNILFLHDSPVYGDVVEAVESERLPRSALPLRVS
jgi:hypothetical protein